MQLENIRFSELTPIHTTLAWGAGNFSEERFFYRNERHYFKLWGRRFSSHRLKLVGSHYRPYDFMKGDQPIASIACGLVTEETCPALVDLIYDRTGCCRGYVTLVGELLEKGTEPNKDFVDTVFRLSVQCGYVFSDLKPDNVIVVNGVCSLVDLDTPPSEIASIDAAMQAQQGVFRPGSATRYGHLVRKHVELRRV